MMLFKNDRNWDPFKEWEQFFTNTAARQARQSPAYESPRYAVQEKEDGFILSLDVPGVRKEDIQIESKGRTLSVTAKRKAAHTEGEASEESTFSYHASFELPEAVQMDGAEASYQDGVLCLALPKVKEATTRAIKVTDGRGEFFGKLVQGFKKKIPEVKTEAKA